MQPEFERPVPAQKRRSKGPKIVIIVAGSMLGLCGLCGVVGIVVSQAGKSGGDAKTAADVSSASAGTTSTNAAKDPAQPKPAAPGLNTAVRDGKFEFVVKSVECGKTSVGTGYLIEKAQGQFCVVGLSVRNIGKEPQTFFDDNQKGAGPNGAKYSTSSAADLAVNEGTSTWINEINPGNAIEGKIVFDVPSGVTLTKLELHDSAFSGGTTVTLG